MMKRHFFREWYLLSRSEQRALLLVGAFLLASIGVRLAVSALPEKEPPGMEQFMRECQLLSEGLKRAEENRSPLHHADLSVVPRRKPPSGQSGQPIDLNSADSVSLLPLPGIGPVLAGRIVRYRNLLGGYFTVNQLQEVYGLSNETLDRIRSRLETDGTALRKIDLDTAGFRELLRHPYLDLEQVKSFVQFRDFKGPPLLPDQLRDNHIWPDSVIQRISPYLLQRVD